jgi:hypothetical protein
MGRRPIVRLRTNSISIVIHTVDTTVYYYYRYNGIHRGAAGL